jgi:hypothetical protein
MNIGSLVKGMKINAERVEKSGGVSVVIAMMKNHPNIETLQMRGCRALFCMSEWEECRPLIVEAGGASVIASIMEKFTEDSQLRQVAHKTMEKLVKKPP